MQKVPPRGLAHGRSSQALPRPQGPVEQMEQVTPPASVLQGRVQAVREEFPISPIPLQGPDFSGEMAGSPKD